MTDRLCQAAALAVLALAAGACGGGGAHSTSARRGGSASTTVISIASTSSTSTPAAAATSSASISSSSATASVSAHATTTTAPPPVPVSTPAAPDGLRQTTGYGTYELCAVDCSGAVPSSLRRPLRLPQLSSGGGCPTTPGGGPVQALGGTRLAIESFIGSAWSGARVTWTAARSYTGPVLIRGRQLGGSGAVGFGEGHVPYDELQLLASGQGAPSGNGRAWLTITRVRGDGCYAYQVDGTSFSDVIVFQAR